jgi:hypothetical protein
MVFYLCFMLISNGLKSFKQKKLEIKIWNFLKKNRKDTFGSFFCLIKVNLGECFSAKISPKSLGDFFL